MAIFAAQDGFAPSQIMPDAIAIAFFSVAATASSPPSNRYATPQAAHDAGTGYTAAIEWTPAAATFAASTVYTAKVTYTAADGYLFDDGITAANFTGLPGKSAATATKVERVSNTTVTATATYKATGA